MDNDKINVEKLDTNNYQAWSTDVKYYLKMKGWWAAVEGNPADDDQDAKAMSVIGLSLKRHQQQLIANCDTAEDAWNTLANIHMAKNNASKMLYRRQLTSLSKADDEPLAKYFGRARGIWDNLVAAGQNVEESDVVFSLLMGLPPAYGTICEIIITNDDDGDLTLDGVLPKLLQAEQRATNKRYESQDTRALFVKPSKF